MSPSGRKTLLSLVVLGYCLVSQANGQISKSRPHPQASNLRAAGRVIEIGKAKVLIPDAVVLDHLGGRGRLYSDFIKGRVVLLSFFFTECTNVCHTQGHDLSRMQALLGKRLGRDVSLISISMNPDHDGPRKLAQWARVFGVRPGWILVSGNDPPMRKMIEDFTGNKPGAREVHFSVVFIGDDRTGTWVSADGLAGPEELIKVIDGISSGALSKRSK